MRSLSRNKRLLSLIIVILSFQISAFSQTGIIKGQVKDKKTGEALIGTTVVIEGLFNGNTIGATTDFDGNYIIDNAPVGIHTLQCSFISYTTQKKEQVTVKAGTTITINFELAEEVVELGGVKIVAKANRESESMLLLDRKKSEEIKESIGSKALSKQGVSDAATATSKIAGVTKSEGSGDVFVRGLGDRYLSTTMNGLPIPSDNVDKKNIDLGLFRTSVIQNIGISKTYSPENYIDQASGNINIVSKDNSSKFSVTAKTGANSNLFENDIWSNFKVSPSKKDAMLSFYSREYSLKQMMTKQGWDPQIASTPLDFGIATSGGSKFDISGNPFSVFYTVSFDKSNNHTEGVFRKINENVLQAEFLDAESYSQKENLTGLLNMRYQLSAEHSLSLNSLFINKLSDNVYEQGRNGKGFFYDMDKIENSFFNRDQNIKRTNLIVNQLIGTHKPIEKNELKWAVGFNKVNADEPNRIRTATGFYKDKMYFTVSGIGPFDNRRSSQEIDDLELNGYIKDKHNFKINDKDFYVSLGLNYRNKTRDFQSKFIGTDVKDLTVVSPDIITSMYQNIEEERIKSDLPTDTYNAILNVYGAFTSFGFALDKFSGSLGARFERDEIDVEWEINNDNPTRKPETHKDYMDIYPNFNFKYTLNEKNFFRFAGSKTVTLPEFKELSPFGYVSPTGTVIQGTPELKKSTNYNLDFKWEYFMSRNELISLATFYKDIEDPINITSLTGGAGHLVFENTGEKAQVYGIELESRINLISTEKNTFKFNLNATKMWFELDLLERFQYNNKTISGLQGAPEFIGNASLSYENKINKIEATVSGNYSSDKIFALGSPKSAESRDIIYNDDIIEKGFITLDAVVSKDITDKLSIKLIGRNLLNPTIKQNQKAKDVNTKIEKNYIVNSYKKGIAAQLSLKYIF